MYVSAVDLLNLSLCSHFFNLICQLNKKFQKVQLTSNQVSNKDNNMRYFLADFLHEFFSDLENNFKIPFRQKISLQFKIFSYDLIHQLSHIEFYVICFIAKGVLMLLTDVNTALVCLYLLQNYLAM